MEIIDKIKGLEEKIISLEKSLEELVDKVKWTRAYINGLSNSCFAYVEPCYGKTTDNKNARHLPFKDANGKVDLPHLRNALARVEQIKPVCPDTNKATAISKAKAKLEAAAKTAGIGGR